MRVVFIVLMNSFYFWMDIVDKFFIAFFTPPPEKVKPANTEEIVTSDFFDHPLVLESHFEEVKPEPRLTYSHIGRNIGKLNKNV